MSFRQCLAIGGGMAAGYLSQVLGRRGSSLPGVVALRLNPAALREFASRAARGVVLVTGTNGKTTTNNMLARILSAAGHRVVCNREGANMRPGVTAAFVRASGLAGPRPYDYAVLEVDEASFPRVAAEAQPRMVVVTNFFRDQLDRYGELDRTITLIRESITGLPAAQLVLNADDPLVAQLGRLDYPVWYYGLAAHGHTALGAAAREARFCPFCGTALRYSLYHYSQLGFYACPGCGFARPKPAVEAHGVCQDGPGLAGTVHLQGRRIPLRLPTRGFYNIHNALAALTAASLLGIETARSLAALALYEPATGRLQRFTDRGRAVYLNLVKNPAGFNESLALVLQAGGTRDICLAINDNAADGRDISWLWDVDFEALEGAPGLLRFVCCGQRAAEMAVRLKYAGLPEERLIVRPGFPAAVRETLAGEGEAVYFLATYTALWPVEAELERLLGGAGEEEGLTGHVDRRSSVP
ncbi:MAG: MurT ligase domain-containing protein [Bacillota bacterium]|nr:MurT ligase domain-containing protein [Bacillota bacterium]